MSCVIPILPPRECRETHDWVPPEITAIRLSPGADGDDNTVLGTCGGATGVAAAAGVGTFRLITNQPLPDVE